MTYETGDQLKIYLTERLPLQAGVTVPLLARTDNRIA